MVSARPEVRNPGKEWSGRPEGDGQGTGAEIKPRLGKEEVKEGATPPNPPPTKPSPGSWVHLPFSPKINRGAAPGRRGGARAGPAWARPLSAVLTPRPSARARLLSAVLTPRSPLARPLRAEGRAPGPALRETAILWSLPRPEGWTMETGFPGSPSCSRVCVGSEGGPDEQGALGRAVTEVGTD